MTAPGSGRGGSWSSTCIWPGPVQTRAFTRRSYDYVVVKGMERLREVLAEVFDLQHAAALLGWDQDTYMPAGGVRNRANQVGTLRRVAHERFTTDEVGELLERAEADTAGMEEGANERSLVRITRREYDKARRLPPELIAEMASSASEARPAWVRSRRESDWERFAPHLAR